MKDFKFCFVYVTVENFKQAETISELAIKKKLCACANIFPEIHSMFEWKGKINLEKDLKLNLLYHLFLKILILQMVVAPLQLQ